mmetsp:Transcript_57477/g.140284  ORF Transcript_57477/g.140284 Transcript_57477/m.140284 type:complete len:741 (+) Transcript_57477:273-2495(+)
MATTVLLRHVPSHDHSHLDHNQDGLNYEDSASSLPVVSDSVSCGRNTSNTTSREDRDMDLDNTLQSIAPTITSSCSSSTAKDMVETSTRSRDVSILDFSPEDEDENEEEDEETVADDDSMRSNGNNHNKHNSSIIMFKELHVELHQEGVDDDSRDDNYDSNGTTKKATTGKHPKTQQTSISSTSPSSSSSRGIMDIGGISSLYSVTDTLVDSLCSSTSSSSLYPYPSCNSDNTSNNNNGGSNTTRSTSPDTSNKAKINGTSTPQPHKRSGDTNDTASVAPMLSGDFCVSGSDFGCDGGGFGGGPGSSLTPAINDILQLLNCTSQPSQSEWDNIWSIKTKDVLRSKQKNQVQDDNRPARAPIRKRLKRLHALRMMSHGIRGSSRHGVTFADQDLNTSFTTDGGGGGGIIGAVEGIDGPIGNSTRTDRTQVEASVAQPFVLDKSYTMTDNTPSFGMMGTNDLGKTMPSFDGYDSDPELNCSMTMDCKPRQHQQHTSFSSPDVSADLGHGSANGALSFKIEDDYPSHKTQEEGDDLYSSSPRSSMETALDALDICGMDENEVQNSVQATLNSTWTLTWHPNPDNMKDFSMSHQPVCTNIWLERGTVINNSGVVIEPAFMWRDAYQPNLTQRRQLNASTQKPWTMRLLNACRIAPCSSFSEIDRSKYPLARPSCCFFLKSCSGQEFLFEAQSTDEMKMITQRWKMAVARFASLAVTEDVSGIANEFFHPTLDSQVLTLDGSGAY